VQKVVPPKNRLRFAQAIRPPENKKGLRFAQTNTQKTAACGGLQRPAAACSGLHKQKDCCGQGPTAHRI
jgi:hypothetical protein